LTSTASLRRNSGQRDEAAAEQPLSICATVRKRPIRHSREQTRRREADIGESRLRGPKHSSNSRESTADDHFVPVKSTPR
jgi:hypothetical protein